MRVHPGESLRAYTLFERLARDVGTIIRKHDVIHKTGSGRSTLRPATMPEHRNTTAQNISKSAINAN